MKDYSASVIDHLGTTYEFKIVINDKFRSGRMSYLNEEYVISQCSKSTVTNGLIFLMHLGQYIKVKVLLTSSCNEQDNLLEIIVGDAITRYVFDSGSCKEFQNYVTNLNLPNANQSVFKIYDEKPWEGNFSIDGLKPQLSLYLGWAPIGSSPFVKFVNVTINNIDVDLSTIYSWPGGRQGVILPMGNYTPNQQYIISWKCETSLAPYKAKTVVGYFVNNDLNTKKILRIKEVDSYDEWTDSATILLMTDD
ncbi:hypothetical protein CJD36_020165 [Flavipsychrobacter stenotrophus]|uniref:Uncharacterized protein n=1 Tax=Flavipsychrobacter stenotrophus TaxID=2077091 RepID=A0A2S7SR73_9BACT|nr:hypothetical protein [Flavipsychrobacter stenotrophus]PQJ09115.1 hypothetical protein CJD36_020165 [Flavipsychrobacter stenotrophus]